MNILQIWQEALLVSGNQVLTTFLIFLPSFLGAVIILIVGIIIAGLGKRAIEEVLKMGKVEQLSVRSGFAAYLERADIKANTTEILGNLVKWLILLIFFIAAVDIVGLTSVANVLGQVLSYVPNIVAAGLILAAGVIIANLVDGLVRGAVASITHETARPVGRLARWVVIVVAFFAALDQLRIAPTLIETFFQGLTWTLVLVFGLAIGLGSKDLVAKILDDWYKKIK